MNDEDLRRAVDRMVRQHDDGQPPPTDRIWAAMQRDRTSRRRRTRLVQLCAAAAVIISTASVATIVARSGHHRITTTTASMPDAARAIVSRHLASTDSLIRAFQTQAATNQMDPSLADQASDLELATRRIQDGGFTSDSATTGLLADVDLVLTQIASMETSPGAPRLDVEMVKYTITTRGVLTRLHTAMLPGNSQSTAVAEMGSEQ